ncbi:MAG: RDD family protein [Flavobacteriales bacterium]|nr:RDD family protein [Flavobacteriales bacterium]MCW8913447.1 RDD family protein [Flavobacteriales bacterium]MCW8938674.1 RDD family protein [Flavobacteriales bacterium]MCW8967839.1 RDD family protein [Flavobacteriales bacterium]MCW8990678.1 RDD family protein [Flavobacteriales bacterium]
MSKRTDEELIKIVTVDKDGYEPLAVEAATKEIELREIDSSKVKIVESELFEKKETQDSIDSNSVSPFARALHLIIDTIAYFILTFILSATIGTLFASVFEGLVDLFGYFILIISYFIYYVFMEVKFQKTLGKFITQTKVVMHNGQKPLLTDILTRTAYRLIPFDWISYLIKRNGLHDYLSQTRVVKDNVK